MVPSFIMGFDQETKGAGDRICAFVEQHNLPVVMLNLLQALPNTALWDRLKQENRLTETGVSADMMDASFNFLPTRPAAEIARGVHPDGGLPVRAHQISGPDLPVLSGHETDSRRRREEQKPGPRQAEGPFAVSGPARRSGGAAQVGLAPGDRGRLPAAILATVSWGFTGKTPAAWPNIWPNAPWGKIFSGSGQACWPEPAGPGRTKWRRLNRVTRMALAAGDGIWPNLKQVSREASSDHHSPGAVHRGRFPGCARLLSQDCIYLLFIYYKNVSNEEKKFTGTESRRCPEVQ